MKGQWYRGGWGWIDRLLLALVLLLQVLILLRTGRVPVADGVQSAIGEPTDVESMGAHEAMRPMSAPISPVVPPPAGPFDAMVDRMNWMMAGAMRDWDSMSRMMSRADLWPQLDPTPTLDMREDERAYTVVLTLPGVGRDDIRVTLDNRLLTVSIPRAVPGGGRRSQVIRLPGPVGEAGAATAVLTNGVLRVSIPKGSPPLGAYPVGLRLF